jgi:Xaa-Pro aminopeptidase
MRPVLLLLAATSTLAAQEPISKTEYAARRDSLAARVGTGAVIAFGGVTPTTDYGTFYQLPAFNYLTGYQLADAALVMIVQAGKPASTTLFINRTAPRRSIYYGAEPDSATLASTLGLASRPIADITRVADSIAEMGYPIYHVRDFRAADFAGQDSLTKGAQFIKALAARNPGLQVHDAHPFVNALRARKSEAELALIRKAAEISAEGHKELMRKATEGAAEYDYQAIIEGAFLRGGAERPAYGAIVGSGPLSSQLHYMKNRRRFEPGDVVVVDAAAEFHGYAADVTRTIPVSGTFTEEQRAIYRLVRDAQAAAERNAKAGMPFAASTDSSVAVRAKGLAKLGLVEAEDATYDPPWEVDCAKTPRACQQAYIWMIHGITHGLGLEVHDPMQAYTSGTFQVGDAFTIEPGIYINPKFLDMLPDTPKNRAFIAKVRPVVQRYANAGVRIEDAYVLTDKGLEWISRVPRDLDDVETLTRRPKPVP